MSSSVLSIEQKMQTALTQQKLGTFDEEGKLRQFDIREDPEQRAKCEQTMELLLAAGYFRVRIKGLSEFDKIVGGLAWSIQACNFTVDIDLLYQENAHLGQKIALTERIVVVLSQMKCPHAIEPHQIQGEDFIHIFPVVQWLVKRVFDRRAEIGDSNRSFALNQFEKIFSQNQNLIHDEPFQKSLEAIRNRNRPKRFCRFLDRSKIKKTERVELVLIEFGKNLQFSRISMDDEKPKQNFDEIFKNFVPEKSKIPARVLTNLVDQQQNFLREVIDDFQEKERLRQEETFSSENGQRLLAFRTLKIKFDKQNELRKNLEFLVDEAKTKKIQSRNVALENREKLEILTEELEKLEEKRKKFDEKVLEEIEQLVVQYEQLREQEKFNVEKFNAEKEKIEREIEKLEQEIKKQKDDDDPEQQEKISQLEEKRKRLAEKTENQQKILAKKNREINALNRRIDEIPSGIELSQYRQAFFQLYNQIGLFYRQTKQNFTLYNTFADLINYMKKEINLLESICQSFPQAISNSQTKENFIKQFESIVETVRQSRMKIENRRTEEKRKRDALNVEWTELIEKTRQYAKILKDFQQAIKENEILHGEK